MRQFVVVGHDAPTDADFSLEDLPGAGRLDLLARCVTAALLVSHGVRDDSRVHLVLADEFTLTVDGATVRRLNPDERSTAALVRQALEQREDAIGHQPVETTPGVELRRRGLEPTLDDVCRAATPVLLHGDGDPVADVEPPSDPAFVLSDHHAFTDAERERVVDRGASAVSLGPRPLHADQAVVVAHNWLDTGGFETY